MVSLGHNELTHCGLVMPCDDINWGQHWLRWWLLAWWLKSITWINVDFPLERYLGIHLRAISQWMLKVLLFCKTSLKIILKVTATSPRGQWVKRRLSGIFGDLMGQGWYIGTWMKWLIFCRWHFEMHFLEWQSSSLASNLIIPPNNELNPPNNEVVGGYIGFSPSVRPSVRPSRLPCPLCNIYSSEWILSILATNYHYYERVCRTQWPLTLTYIFKVIWPWLRKSCPLCRVYSSRWILFIFGTNDHYH